MLIGSAVGQEKRIRISICTPEGPGWWLKAMPAKLNIVMGELRITDVKIDAETDFTQILYVGATVIHKDGSWGWVLRSEVLPDNCVCFQIVWAAQGMDVIVQFIHAFFI